MNKILIIDDDRELCALIKRSVQAENIEADFCNTGKEGLQKLREQEYQLVVLDVMMPRMDGLEVCRRIRKAGNTLTHNHSPFCCAGPPAAAQLTVANPAQESTMVCVRPGTLAASSTRSNGPFCVR